MRRLVLIGCLIVVAFASVATQTPVTGRWRAVLLIPDGETQTISLELDAKGTTVTGNIEGLAIREGRLDGSTLTVEAAATIRSTNGYCTADCVRVIAECHTPPLPPGSYTLVYGEESVALTVPGEAETCTDEA